MGTHQHRTSRLKSKVTFLAARSKYWNFIFYWPSNSGNFCDFFHHTYNQRVIPHSLIVTIIIMNKSQEMVVFSGR